MIDQAYAQGVPMGGTLESQMTAPEFLIWAARDPQGVALNRLQIIKVTAEGERIYDVACSGGKAPDEISRRCVGDDTSVDLSSCEVKGGVPELKTVWRDPDWQKGQAASYYVRALEIPKCRWSTWDAIRNGTPPNPSMKAIIQDRAWSSPIWIE